MKLLRPIEHADLDALERIAEASGCGFTSLPADRKKLAAKIDKAETSFARDVTAPSDEQYLFALEDTKTGELIGTTGIAAKVGISQPLYHFKVRTESHQSRDLQFMNHADSMQVCTDYRGASEICSLYLDSEHRKGFTGKFLSRARFLFMATHPHRFSETVIAEMRGVSDEEGNAPFFGWLQDNFLPMTFSDATFKVGSGDVDFIDELMPNYPIYACLLDDEAKQTVGEVHPHTAPALKLLEREGFAFRGYVDLFDAGPTIEAKLSNIKSVRQSKVCQVVVGAPASPSEDAPTLAISNLSVNHFRAGFTNEATMCQDTNTLTVSPTVADQLHITNGEQVRVIPL